MKTLRHRRFLFSASALALALAALPALPQALAQAPQPAAAASGDAKDFLEITTFVDKNQWADVMKAAEKFLAKYKELSPRSRDARYLLALAYLRQENMQDEAVKELKKLIPDPKVAPEIKEQAMMLLAKAYTMKGIAMAGETDGQRQVRDAVYDEAVKAYDAYLAAYPQSKTADTAYFLSGVLSLEMKRFDESTKRFATVYQRYAQSPLKSDALLNVGKTFLIQANDLMTAKGGKEPKPEDIQKALDLYEKNALPTLQQVFRDSTDLGILNEAQGYIGQIRLTQSQNVKDEDDAKRKQRQTELLNPALDAFRAVRSIEEVGAAQEAKIKALQDAIGRLNPADAVNYLPYKNYYENLIGVETDKKERLKAGTDQYLAARVAIARIFLFLGKYDECRVLLRYLQGQPELFEKDKESLASVGALLCHTYIGQKNLEKSVETYEAFRAAFKGNEAGEDIPLFVANLAVEKGDAKKAEAIVTQGMADYPNWRYANDSVRILIHVALEAKDYGKALELCEKVLATSPKPEVEVETLYIKGAVQEGMAIEKSSPELQDQAYKTFQDIRSRFADTPKAEDAWFRQTVILVGKDPAQAVTELTKYIQALSANSKSDNTKANLATCQYNLGKALDQTGQGDKAVEAFNKLIATYPENDVTPDAFFRIFDIENKKKNYAACVKAMEDYLQKYPTHKNVYFAFSNIAEFYFAGSMNSKDGKPANPTAEDREKGTQKLIAYVDYELEKKIVPSRGENALIKVADTWLKQLAGYGTFDLLPADQKVTWQKAVDSVLAVVEKQLKSYPEGERIPEALERAVKVQALMLKARQSDVAKGSAYFEDLRAKYGKSSDMKAKILVAMGSYLGDTDPQRAKDARKKALAGVPEPLKKGDKIIPSFAPGDWDRLLADFFEEKKYDDVTKLIARIRVEYPQDGNPSPIELIQINDAQAVTLFWEGKVLEEQGKVAEAGAKYTELGTKYPKTSKKMEADYGVLNGKFVAGQLKAPADQRAALKRLQEIFGVTTTKTFDVQAKALFLTGQIREEMQEYDAAIAAYSKVATSFGAVSKVAGDGLWRAGNLLERQANKELPVKLPAELAAAAAKARAAEDAEKKAAEKASDAKSPEAKPGEKKPDTKPADKKPADKTTAASTPAKK